MLKILYLIFIEVSVISDIVFLVLEELLETKINQNKIHENIYSNKEDYETLLVANIEQEYEHNLAQQIYISDKCWDIINAAKNTTIQLIRKASMQEKVDSADKLREVVLSALMDKQAPSSAALAFIKDEVSHLW